MAYDYMQGLQSATIKVTSEELKYRAESVRSKNNKLKQMWQNSKTVFRNTSGYWNGDGADSFRAAADSLDKLLEAFFKKWEDVAVKLEVIAGVYEEAERQNVSEAGSLPTDVIK